MSVEDNPRFRQSLCFATAARKASRRLSQLYDDALEPCGLRSTQYAILSQLDARTDDPPTMAVLAEALVIDRSALGHNLRPLERDGLLRLAEGAEDRRRRHVVLSTKGKRKFREAYALWKSAQMRFTQVYGATEGEAFRKTLLGALPTTNDLDRSGINPSFVVETAMNTSVVRKKMAKPTLSHGAMTAFSFGAAILLAGSSGVPTPLYHFYQQSMHLTSFLVTIVFSIYAFSLLGALLTIGGLSDYVGRKPVILASLLTNVAAMLLFATATGVGQLILARAVQGISVGMGITALGAAILDTDRARGPLLNSVFIFLGLTVGTLGSAVLVTFAPDPMHLVYDVFIVLTLIMSALLWIMPETVHAKSGGWSVASPSCRRAAPVSRYLSCA